MGSNATVLVALLSLWGWGCAPEPVAEQSAERPMHAVRFADATQAAGLDFVHVSGGPQQRYILEAMGSGVAFFDFDADGWLDVFAVNGTRAEDAPETGNRLWRNVPTPDGGRAFAEVTTQAAGLEQTGWGMGCAVADYDNDGDLDLYVTYWGPNALYRNEGNGTFTAVEAGTGDQRWGASAAFGDVDLDGWLDLYVANYVAFDLNNPPGDGQPCSGWKGLSVFCGPHGLDGQADVLYRNEGNGAFADVSAATGIDQRTHLGLGCFSPTTTAMEIRIFISPTTRLPTCFIATTVLGGCARLVPLPGWPTARRDAPKLAWGSIAATTITMAT